VAALERLLGSLVHAMRVPPGLDVLAADDDDTVEFNHYRRSLRQLLEMVSGVSEDLVLAYVHAVAAQTLQALHAASVADTELAIYLIHCVGDSIRGPPARRGHHGPQAHASARTDPSTTGWGGRRTAGTIKYVADPATAREPLRASEARLSTMLAQLLASGPYPRPHPHPSPSPPPQPSTSAPHQHICIYTRIDTHTYIHAYTHIHTYTYISPRHLGRGAASF
jgi:hypothetical protein